MRRDLGRYNRRTHKVVVDERYDVQKQQRPDTLKSRKESRSSPVPYIQEIDSACVIDEQQREAQHIMHHASWLTITKNSRADAHTPMLSRAATRCQCRPRRANTSLCMRFQENTTCLWVNGSSRLRDRSPSSNINLRPCVYMSKLSWSFGLYVRI